MKFGIREIVFGVVMLGLLGSSYFLIFEKANKKRAAVETEIDRKQKALADLDRATAGIDDLKAKVEELQRAIDFFESKLPQQREIQNVLREVSQLAEANKLKTQTIKTLKEQRYANYSEQPIEISLSGDFYGFYKFQQQLEKLPRLTRVMGMKLEKINDQDGAMSAELTVSIFFEPDAAAAPAPAPAPAPAATGAATATAAAQ